MASHYGYWQKNCNASLRWRAFSGHQVHASTRGPELLAAVAGTHVAMMQRLLMYEARLGKLPGDIIMPLHMDNTASQTTSIWGVGTWPSGLESFARRCVI